MAPPHPTGSGRELDAHAAVRASRLSLADHLDGLDPDDWDRPSLCEGWTVADVVAHLTLSTTETWWDFIRGMVRYRGNFDRANANRAREQAERHPPQELVAMLRDDADSRAHSPGSSTLDQLIDLLVHGQDIARAIGTTLTAPTDVSVAALDRALASRWYGARTRLADISLTASDVAWQAGTGDEVRGPVTSLLLLATGRPAGLDDVEGAGVELVRRRMGET